MSVNAVNRTTLSTTDAGQTKKTFQQEEPVSIIEFDAGKAKNTIDIDLVSTDGKDDGKLSAGEAAKLAVKGAGHDVKNALTSPLGIASMIGVAALALCPVTAPFVAPLAVAGAAIGVGAGALKTLSGVSKMVSADTDAEAKGGAKEVGSGVYTTGISATALKASLNQMAKVEGSHMEAAYRDGTSKTRAYFRDVNDLTGNKFGSFTAKFRAGATEETVSADDGSQILKPDAILDRDGNVIGCLDEQTGSYYEPVKIGVNRTVSTPDAENGYPKLAIGTDDAAVVSGSKSLPAPAATETQAYQAGMEITGKPTTLADYDNYFARKAFDASKLSQAQIDEILAQHGLGPNAVTTENVLVPVNGTSTVVPENVSTKTVLGSDAGNVSAVDVEIMQKSQTLSDLQDKINLSWAQRPSYSDVQAWTQWKTQHGALESELGTAQAALDALFQDI